MTRVKLNSSNHKPIQVCSETTWFSNWKLPEIHTKEKASTLPSKRSVNNKSCTSKHMQQVICYFKSPHKLSRKLREYVKEKHAVNQSTLRFEHQCNKQIRLGSFLKPHPSMTEYWKLQIDEALMTSARVTTVPVSFKVGTVPLDSVETKLALTSYSRCH